MWDDLTMAEKAKLINIFVKGGILKLSQMKHLYETGGDLPLYDNYIYKPEKVSQNVQVPLEEGAIEEARREDATKDLHYILDKVIEYTNKRRDIDEKYIIPYDKHKKIKLSGVKTDKLRGTVTSTNILDTLAKYGALAKQDPNIVLGMAGNESNFGMYPEKYMLPEDYNSTSNFLETEGMITPAQLVNNDRYYASPYNDAEAEIIAKSGAAYDKYADARVSYVSTDFPTDSLANTYAKKGRAYADKLASEIDWEEHPLIHAFKTNFAHYNEGDPNYKSRLIDWGKMAFSSPEIQKWWKESGRSYYAKYSPEILEIFEKK